MQRLIIVRHGDYGGRSLTAFGREDIAKLGERLKSTINGGRILILTSTAIRARESAEILSQILGVEIEENEILGSEDYMEDMEATLGLVRSKKEAADVLILVTHMEFVEEFPSLFGKEELGVDYFPYRAIGKSEAWDINCEQKTITLVR